MKKTLQRKLSVLCMLLISSLFFNPILYADETDTLSSKTNVIKIGKTGSESGQDAETGKNMTLGVKLYFDKINATGGVNGKHLQLINLDDGYNPIKAGENARHLINDEQVIALIGNNGSPTTLVVVPIAEEFKTLLFGPFPGSSFLYKNSHYVITLRPSYADEVKTMVKGLLAAGVKPQEIAFFTQNDAFGDSVHQGGVNALKAAGYPDADKLPHGRYTRNTLNVEDGLVTIMDQANRTKIMPKAFIMGGVYPDNAKFAKLASKQYPNAIFLAVSGFFNAKDFTNEDNGKIFATQVVPYYHANLPTTKEYLEDLKKYGNGAEPSSASLQAYIYAKVFVMGLKSALQKNQLNRGGLIDAFDSLHNVDAGIGEKLNLDNSHNPGFTHVWVTMFKDGKFVPMEWSDLKSIIKH